MVLELFKLQGQIDVNGGPQALQTLSQIDAAGKQAASGLNTVAQTAMGVATGMGLYGLVMQGVSSVTNLVKEGFLGLNQQLESSRIGFTTMMGDAGEANRMLKDLQDFAATTPFEFPQLLESAQRLQAMGFAAKEVIPMMTAIGDAAAGLGRGPETIQRVTLALGQMQAKAKVSADEMLQLTEAGIPAWKLLADGMGKSTAEVMKLSEKGLIPAKEAINMLVDGMEKQFPGMMKSMENTWQGATSTIKDNIRNAIQEVTSSAFTGLEGVAVKFKDWTSSIKPETFQQIGEYIRVVVQNADQLAGILAGAGTAWVTYWALTDGVKMVGNNLTNATNFIESQLTAINGVILNGKTAVMGLEESYNSITAGRAAPQFAKLWADAKGDIDAFARSCPQAAAAVGEITEATNGFKAAMLSTGIGALVVALGALAYWAVTAKSSTDKFIESVNKENNALDAQRKAVESQILVTEKNIKTMKEKEDSFIKAVNAVKAMETETVKLDNALSSGQNTVSRHTDAIKGLGNNTEALSDAFDKMAIHSRRASEVDDYGVEEKAKLQAAIKELNPVIGEQALAHIMASDDIKKAYEDEIKAQELHDADLKAKLKLSASAILQYSNYTINQTADRIENLGKEAEAFGFWNNAVVIAMSVWEKWAMAQYTTFAGLAKVADPGGLLSKAAGAAMATAKNTEAAINDIKATSTAEEINKLAAKQQEAVQRHAQALELLEGDTKSAADNSTASATSAAKGHKEAAEKVKEAWQDIQESMHNNMDNIEAKWEQATAVAEEHGDKVEALKDKYAMLGEEYQAQTDGLQKMNAERDKYNDGSEESKKKLAELDKAVADETKKQADLKKQMAETTHEMKTQQDELTKMVEEAGTAYKKYLDDKAQNDSDYAAKKADLIQKEQDQIDALNQKYEDTLKSTTDSIANFTSLFESVQTKEVTGDQLTQNLQGQVDTLEKWQSDMRALASKGISSDFLKEIEKLGPGSAAQVSALASMTDDQLQDYVGLWERKMADAKTQATSQLADTRDSISQEISQIQTQTQTQLTEYQQEWKKTNDGIYKNTTETLQKLLEEAGKTGGSFVTTLAAAIVATMPEFTAALGGLTGELGSTTTDTGAASTGKKGTQTGTSTGGEQIQSEAKGVQVAVGEMQQKVSTDWGAMASDIETSDTKIKEKTSQTWTEIRAKLNELWTQIKLDEIQTWAEIKGNLFGILTEIDRRFNETVQASFHWGQNFMRMFTSGIEANMPMLEARIESIAEAMHRMLGFASPTEEGPGSTADQWAPNFVSMFAQGITDTLPELQASVNLMANTIIPPVSVMPGGTAPVAYIEMNVYGIEDAADSMDRELRIRGWSK